MSRMIVQFESNIFVTSQWWTDLTADISYLFLNLWPLSRIKCLLHLKFSMKFSTPSKISWRWLSSTSLGTLTSKSPNSTNPVNLVLVKIFRVFHISRYFWEIICLLSAIDGFDTCFELLVKWLVKYEVWRVAVSKGNNF